MIAFPAETKVWIATGVIYMRCGGMTSLSLRDLAGLGRDFCGGEIFCLRGRKADMVKLFWHDGVGMSLYMTRLEAGKFLWPTAAGGEAVARPATQGEKMLALRLVQAIACQAARHLGGVG